jgi:hypothetical protein
MSDFGNLLQGIFGLSQVQRAADIAQQGAAQQAAAIIQGGEVAAQGALLSAEGFRVSAKSVQEATKFNLGIHQVNTQRKLSATARQFQRVTGQQISQQVTSGLALGSKSFLMVQAETRNSFERSLKNLAVDAENQRQSMRFQSQVRQVQLENQARASEFRAASERVLASNRATEARFQGEIAQNRANMQIGKALPNLLSQVINLDG